ncbi:helix-turn-helix transcriptional regulator [Lysinibacillus varians]|uniref:Transcriptional regulator n=1 Tax=Lysinibacillus varians TaxID=1145276 RepID=A0ABY2T5X8_9BACI|nr:helix-turn-helix domain-containing protein [Lysinibacillus varians]AHN22055.1 hypothetical protein T479_12325 [Lysinibacillus varians]TKI52648.1 transcriptional regulator [Lysinibacillus varians]
MRLISGYRKMTGLSQKEMANKLKISEVTYRNKENGKKYFNEEEIKQFFELVRLVKRDVTIEEIFFS